MLSLSVLGNFALLFAKKKRVNCPKRSWRPQIAQVSRSVPRQLPQRPVFNFLPAFLFFPSNLLPAFL